MGEPDRTADKTDVMSAQLSLEFAFVKQILSPILPAFSHKSIQPSASNGPQGLCAQVSGSEKNSACGKCWMGVYTGIW